MTDDFALLRELMRDLDDTIEVAIANGWQVYDRNATCIQRAFMRNLGMSPDTYSFELLPMQVKELSSRFHDYERGLLARRDAWIDALIEDARVIMREFGPFWEWVADNVDFRAHAYEVLIVANSWPMTLTKLDALATGMQWCRAYTSYRRHAIAAGVIGDD
jgi:hypothetical protein